MINQQREIDPYLKLPNEHFVNKMEPEFSYFYEAPDSGNVYVVYDLKNIPAILNVAFSEEHIDMTALKDYMWGDPVEDAVDKALREDAALQRLSLAYEDLQTFPNVILEKVADNTKILDLSYNDIQDFSFLRKMTKLKSFICDHNRIYSDVELPYMPNLELFWMNHCDLKELLPFCKTLQSSFPNLKYLSLMGNKAVPSLLRGDGIYDCQQYRIFIISLFPRLIHLDESKVTHQEREEANEIKRRSLMNKYLPSASSYLRRTTEKLEGLLPSGSPSGLRVNNIV